MTVHSLKLRASPDHPHAEHVQAAARQLFSAEAAVDAALRETSLLVASVIEARTAAGLAPCVVQRTLRPLSETQATLFATREHILRTHGEMRRVQVRIGASAVKLGGLDKDDQDGPRPDVGFPSFMSSEGASAEG